MTATPSRGFSNRGTLLDVLAPGASITSSIPDDSWATYNGTSMATPHVVGALALLRQRAPSRPIASLVQDLRSSGTAIAYPSGGGTVTTRRIDVLTAITASTTPQLSLSGTPAAAAEGSPLTFGGTWSSTSRRRGHGHGIRRGPDPGGRHLVVDRDARRRHDAAGHHHRHGCRWRVQVAHRGGPLGERRPDRGTHRGDHEAVERRLARRRAGGYTDVPLGEGHRPGQRRPHGCVGLRRRGADPRALAAAPALARPARRARQWSHGRRLSRSVTPTRGPAPGPSPWA